MSDGAHINPLACYACFLVCRHDSSQLLAGGSRGSYGTGPRDMQGGGRYDRPQAGSALVGGSALLGGSALVGPNPGRSLASAFLHVTD